MQNLNRMVTKKEFPSFEISGKRIPSKSPLGGKRITVIKLARNYYMLVMKPQVQCFCWVFILSKDLVKRTKKKNTGLV